ncbi:MAG: SDR family oxidoreductase [Verrucomicrobiota bacterium]
MKVAVTGANGFVGRRLCKSLRDEGHEVRGGTRTLGLLPAGVEGVSGCELDPERFEKGPWERCLGDVDVVIHAAARVHVMQDSAQDPLQEFRRINGEGTLAIARVAQEMGVKRFVYVSSIKVMGERTEKGNPFRVEDTPQPVDPYGQSKWEAEQGIQELCHDLGLEWSIVRPPLVHGKGAGGNLETVRKMIHRRIPLPVGAIDNRRDLVGLENLCDLLREVASREEAVGQTFHVSDEEPVSTLELVRAMAAAMHRKVVLLPIPSSMLSLGLAALGKRELGDRLLANLEVDVSHVRDRLGWQPKVSLEAGLHEAFREGDAS